AREHCASGAGEASLKRQGLGPSSIIDAAHPRSVVCLRKQKARCEVYRINDEGPRDNRFAAAGKKPAVRRGYAASGSGRRSTLKPSLAIWAAKRLALISVERRSKWLAPRS